MPFNKAIISHFWTKWNEVEIWRSCSRIPAEENKDEETPNKQGGTNDGGKKKLEQSLKAMLIDFKQEISKQIGELRQDFETFSMELKQVRMGMNQIRTGLGEAISNIQEAEQRIHELEEREVSANETKETK